MIDLPFILYLITVAAVDGSINTSRLRPMTAHPLHQMLSGLSPGSILQWSM